MAQQHKVEALEPITAYEKAIIFGDVAGLTEQERVVYLKELANSVGVSPISRPFGYLPTKQGITVYLTATGAAQLRRIHNVSVTDIVDEGVVNGFYRVKVFGRMPNGRVDVEYGSVGVTYRDGNMHNPQDLENDRKKCVTQAKTRLTKSMVGLAGIIAEEELEDIGASVPEEQPRQLTRGAETVNTDTGEITQLPPRRVTVHEPPPTATSASQAQHDRIIELAGELFGTSGVAVTLHPDYTEESAAAEIAALEERVADASMSAASVVLATEEQRAKVAACVAAFAKFGRPIEPPPASFSSAEIEQWLAVKRAVMSELKATANKDRSLSYAAAG